MWYATVITRVCVLIIASGLVDSTDGTSLGGVPQEKKMLKGHLPSVIYHQVY